MQLYSVKLNAGHSATKEQNCNGYLGYNLTTLREREIYSLKEANKKAAAFGGEPVKAGLAYYTKQETIINFLEKQLMASTVNILGLIKDKPISRDELIYKIEEKAMVLEMQCEAVQEEVRILQIMTMGAEYVVFI